jgi:hypothetical protein
MNLELNYIVELLFGFLDFILDLHMILLLQRCLRFLPGEFIIADKAYIAVSAFITPIKRSQTLLKYKFNFIIYSKQIIVENTLKRIKHFGFAHKEWRYKIELHILAMKLAANIINIDLKFRPVRK